jgi:hypothetical protein
LLGGESMENYDTEALYLYCDGWKYRVGKIEKINDKSIRMEFGIKIKKEDFSNIHKLTDGEIKIFKEELVRRLSNTSEGIKNILNSIHSLKIALNSSDLVCVNSENLQKKLDLLNVMLSKELPKVFRIDDKELIFGGYSDALIKKNN